MSNNQSRVVIAGGGIGGLACAYVLAKQGYAVHVLEQASGFGEIGAGIQLGPNIFKMFEYLGLTEEINKLAYFPPGLGMNDIRTGERVVRVQLGQTALASYGFPYGVIYRADLHQVFLDACKRFSNITLQTNAKVVSFNQNAQSVRVLLEDGTSIEASALIGADGMWSKVRESIVGDGKPRVSGHIAYRAVLKKADVPQHLWDDDVTLWGGEKTHLVTYPLRRGELLNLVAVFHSKSYDEGWNTFGDTQELNERFAQSVPQVLELLRPRAG
jgi:3-hydroxybenzoate 6-monooxygenase